MQRENHLEYIARDAVSNIVQDSKQADELPLPKSVKANISKYIATPLHEKELEKWFGFQVRGKALFYWCCTPNDHPLMEDIDRHNNPAFDFHNAYMNMDGIETLDGIQCYEEAFDSKLCRCSEVRETRQFIIVDAFWTLPPSHHQIYRMIEKFHRSNEKCHCTDLVILSFLPPEIFFRANLDILTHVMMVQREDRRSPPFSLSSRLIQNWFENRSNRKALYYWCISPDYFEPYLEITRHISDRSQIYYSLFYLHTQTSYPENCQFIILDGFDHVCATKSHREFLMRCIKHQYDELLDEVTGEPCKFKQGAKMIFISHKHPKHSFGSTFPEDCLDLVIHETLFPSFDHDFLPRSHSS